MRDTCNPGELQQVWYKIRSAGAAAQGAAVQAAKIQSLQAQVASQSSEIFNLKAHRRILGVPASADGKRECSLGRDERDPLLVVVKRELEAVTPAQASGSLMSVGAGQTKVAAPKRAASPACDAHDSPAAAVRKRARVDCQYQVASGTASAQTQSEPAKQQVVAALSPAAASIAKLTATITQLNHWHAAGLISSSVLEEKSVELTDGLIATMTK
eukprot:COSAG01_NODE_16566_length_1225_cov_1.248668_1_plen_214_part_00